MDMNPFANNNVQTMTGTPDYLKQNQRPGGAPGVVSNMVKAIMDGNNKFNQMGSKTGPAGVPGAAISGATGPTSFGGSAGPMPLAPGPGMSAGPMAPPAAAPSPDVTSTISGGAGPMAPLSPSFEGGTPAVPFASTPGIMQNNNTAAGYPGMPNGDNGMKALFSRIPGQEGGMGGNSMLSGMFGGGGFFGG